MFADWSVDFTVPVGEIMEGFDGEEQDFKDNTKANWEPVGEPGLCVERI